MTQPAAAPEQQQFTITHRWTGAVLYTGGGKLLRDVVIAAVGSGADLRYADLRGADLGGAYLGGAYLRGAKIGDKTLVSERPVLQIGPIGSRADYLVAYLTNAGVMICAGCFFGTLNEFRAACVETHGGNAHGREYAAAIVLIEAHAALWTTAAEPADAAAKEAA